MFLVIPIEVSIINSCIMKLSNTGDRYEARILDDDSYSEKQRVIYREVTRRNL